MLDTVKLKAPELPVLIKNLFKRTRPSIEIELFLF